MSKRRIFLYGLNIETEFSFRSNQLPSRGSPDLWFGPAGPESEEKLLGFERLFSRPWIFPTSRSRFEVLRRREREWLRFERHVEFHLEGSMISYRIGPEGSPAEVEMLFLSAVMAYWLERMGRIAMHASAVSLDESAVAFAADSTGGKTSLAATLMRHGAKLLTDDILPIEMNGPALGHPGYPELKLGPVIGEWLLSSRFEAFEPVEVGSTKVRVPVGGAGFGSFQPVATKLAAIFLIDRNRSGNSGPKTEVTLLSPRMALVELLRFSFAARLVHGAGMSPSRLDRLGDLAAKTPVYRLGYPSGVEYLPGVVDQVRLVLDQRS